MGAVQRHVVTGPNNLRVREPSVREDGEILGDGHVEAPMPQSECAVWQVVANDQPPCRRKKGADLCIQALRVALVPQFVHSLQGEYEIEWSCAASGPRVALEV